MCKVFILTFLCDWDQNSRQVCRVLCLKDGNWNLWASLCIEEQHCTVKLIDNLMINLYKCIAKWWVSAFLWFPGKTNLSIWDLQLKGVCDSFNTCNLLISFLFIPKNFGPRDVFQHYIFKAFVSQYVEEYSSYLSWILIIHLTVASCTLKNKKFNLSKQLPKIQTTVFVWGKAKNTWLLASILC